jgi:uncharacterized surface protein with fasciclin (FAS1) repeats
MNIRHTLFLTGLCSLLATAAVPAFAADMSMNMPTNPMVGGHSMSMQRSIVANAMDSNDNKILVAAVKQAGLAATLQGPGPFTVFAPTDEAFSAVPKGTLNALMQPRNKAKLVDLLTYHVVSGRYDYAALSEAIHQGGGIAHLKTVEGHELMAKMNGPRNIVLVDDKGIVAHISTYDVYQSNGVIQIIDRVLMP